MSLQEVFDQAVREKNIQAEREAEREAKKEAEREASKAMEQLLPENVRALFASYVFASDSANAYRATLPLQLVSAAKDLISELISLCPEKFWCSPPAKVDVSDVYSSPFSTHPGAYSIDPEDYTYDPKEAQGYAQYRATDGSVHIGSYDLRQKKSWFKEYDTYSIPFRLAMWRIDFALNKIVKKRNPQAKEAFLREIQEELDKHNRDTSGSREFFIFTWYSGGRDTNCHALWKPIIIFRDGAVYDPYQSAHDQFYERDGELSPLAGLMKSCYRDGGNEDRIDKELDKFRYCCNKKVREWAQAEC